MMLMLSIVTDVYLCEDPAFYIDYGGERLF